MPYEAIETRLAAGRQEDMLARFRTIPTPRRVPARIVDLLTSKKADRALARLKRETDLLDQLEAELSGHRERQFVLQQEHAALRSERQHYEDRRREKERWGYDATTEEAALRLLEAELRGVAERQQGAGARTGKLGDMCSALAKRVERCNKWLTQRGETARFLPPAPVDKKLTFATAREIRLQLGADLEEFPCRPRTAAEVKQQLVAWVEREIVAPNISALFDRDREIYSEDRPINVPMPTVSAYVGGPYFPGGAEINGVYTPSLLGLVLWLGKEEFLRRLLADADLLADKENALDEATLLTKLAECRRKILEAERVEEALAWQLLQDGEEIVLHGDADVRAILAIE